MGLKKRKCSFPRLANLPYKSITCEKPSYFHAGLPPNVVGFLYVTNLYTKLTYKNYNGKGSKKKPRNGIVWKPNRLTATFIHPKYFSSQLNFFKYQLKFLKHQLKFLKHQLKFLKHPLKFFKYQLKVFKYRLKIF